MNYYEQEETLELIELIEELRKEIKDLKAELLQYRPDPQIPQVTFSDTKIYLKNAEIDLNNGKFIVKENP